jgi:hypothetical protein
VVLSPLFSSFLLLTYISTSRLFSPLLASFYSLADAPAGTQQLQVGHDDTLMGGKAVARADVAAIVVTAVTLKAIDLRFDICGAGGAPTTNLPALLKSARWPWQR